MKDNKLNILEDRVVSV